MSYINPYEQTEPLRCKQCDECMTEIVNILGAYWECRNPTCEECTIKYKACQNPGVWNGEEYGAWKCGLYYETAGVSLEMLCNCDACLRDYNAGRRAGKSLLTD